jgi:hypothetical protein
LIHPPKADEEEEEQIRPHMIRMARVGDEVEDVE